MGSDNTYICCKLRFYSLGYEILLKEMFYTIGRYYFTNKNLLNRFSHSFNQATFINLLDLQGHSCQNESK